MSDILQILRAKKQLNTLQKTILSNILQLVYWIAVLSIYATNLVETFGENTIDTKADLYGKKFMTHEICFKAPK